MNIMRHPFKSTVRSLAAVVLTGALAFYGGTSVYAATAAGTQIKNLATVTYEDASGTVFSAQSNEAVVTVAHVYSATIGTDVDINSAPGQTVYLPYVLSNTGNGLDTYTIGAVDAATGTATANSVQVYLDTNGNGQPDPTETVVTTVDLNGGDVANLVVAVQVPVTATAGQTIDLTLTAQAHEGTGAPLVGQVTDLTPLGGADTLDDTNQSTITITGDAVLVTTKSSTLDETLNQITYTITVKNNGNSAATDVVIFDGYPENTTLIGTPTASGLLGTNGDTLGTDAILDEPAIGLDLNGDGNTTDVGETALGFDLNTDGDIADTAVPGIYAVDASLAPNATVTLTFTVSYDPAVLGGGYIVSNTAHSTGDLNNDGIADPVVHSNSVSDTLSQTYGVTIADTGVGAAPGVNDGGDDDPANDDQLVDEVASGGTVIFTNVLSNTGNGDDIYELSVAQGNFPPGTVFTFWDATGSVQLTDTNGAGGPDSGVVPTGTSVNIVVRAKLPAGVSGDAALPATEYEAVITAISSGDATQTDTANLSLGTILPAAADLHGDANGTVGTDEDPLGAPDYTALSTTVGDAGTTVNIPIYIDNGGANADSYQLNAGSSYDGTTLGALAPGWTIEYFVGDGSGNPTGPAITSTPPLLPNTVDYEVIAVVSIPADQTQATGDFTFDNDVDGTAETIDQNGDGDGDYPIFFTILSPTSGATDIILDAVDVNPTRALTLSPNGANQVEAGGTVTYSHTLANTGNGVETVELETSHSQPTWASTVTVDTNGDGIPDTELGNLVPGSTIDVQQPDGSVVTISVTDGDTDGNPELELPAGAIVPLEATVFAPATAVPGELDVLTISATNTDTSPGAPSASLTDQTEVIDSNVRLTKTVAVDTDCDGTPESAFAETQTTEVAPGECAIWELKAVNQGSTDASNVKILDTVTPFTTYETGSLEYCLNLTCTLATMTDIKDADAGEVNGSNVTFYVGTGADPAATPALGGILVPGEIATARFRVVVD